MSFNWQKCVL